MAKMYYNAKSAKENNIIGRKIAEVRKRKHLTQGELIKRLTAYGVEVQQGAITKWENGMTTPTAYQIFAIALALNINDMITEFTDMECQSDHDLNEQGLKKLDEYRELLVASGKYKPRIPEFAPIRKMITIPTSSIKAAAGSRRLKEKE